MAENYNTYYGYLFEKSLSATSDKEARLTVLRYFDEPITYNYMKSFNNIALNKYEMIFNRTIGIEENNLYVNGDYTTDYTYLWYGIVRIFQEIKAAIKPWISTPTIDTIRSEFSEIDINSLEGCFSFSFNNKKYYIYYEVTSFSQNYELPEKYYVFYDDVHQEGVRVRNTIESFDVHEMLRGFAKDLGKENLYTGVAMFEYNGDTCSYDEEGNIVRTRIKQDFYIFYTRLCPTKTDMEHIVREQLILDKGGRDNAAFAYPNLFEGEIRRIYILRENRAIPVSYNKLCQFLTAHPHLLEVEVITMLQYRCPLVVESGVSDTIESYSPVEYLNPTTAGEKEANKFLFMLSSIVNYIDGTNIELEFIDTTGVVDKLETEGYLQFQFNFITWRVYKD